MTTPDPVSLFIDRVRETIARYDLLPRGRPRRADRDPVVVGVSGGPDSVALVHVLDRLAREGHLAIAPVAAHLHHGLRGADADRDARLVADLAARLHLPYCAERADIRAEAEAAGVGVEEAGRWARRRFFRRVARDAGARKVALGHHGADRVETVLFHVLRGTGIDGLATLGPRGPLVPDEGIEIVRPLMHPSIGRNLVLAYLEHTGLDWREDKTNADTDYTRNRLRHEVLPLLGRAVNPAVEEALFRLADQAEAAQAVLADALERVWREIVREVPPVIPSERSESRNLAVHSSTPAGSRRAGSRAPREILIDADDFAPLRPWLRGAILRRAIDRLGGGLKHMSAARTGEVVAALLSGTVAGPVDLPGGLVAERRRRVIRVGPRHPGEGEP